MKLWLFKTVYWIGWWIGYLQLRHKLRKLQRPRWY